MCIKQIYKYSVIGVFVVLSLFRIQIMYANKVDDLNNKLASLESTNIKLEETNVSLAELVNHMEEFKENIKDDPIYEWPIAVDDYDHLTSEFGYRLLVNPYTGGARDSEHIGIDLTGTTHARAVAISNGVVVEHYPAPNRYYKGHPILGGMIKIKHTDDSYAVYGHLSTTYVSEGDKVIANQVIGRIGNTGMSFGEHLHFELRNQDDVAIQPLFYLKNPNGYKEGK